VQASLLMAEGHLHANRYPLSKLWIETEIARERINARLASETALIHSAIVAVLAPDGKGVKNLNRQLEDLNDG
jgi:hypothetical protein